MILPSWPGKGRRREVPLASAAVPLAPRRRRSPPSLTAGREGVREGVRDGRVWAPRREGGRFTFPPGRRGGDDARALASPLRLANPCYVAFQPRPQPLSGPRDPARDLTRSRTQEPAREGTSACGVGAGASATPSQRRGLGLVWISHGTEATRHGVDGTDPMAEGRGEGELSAMLGARTCITHRRAEPIRVEVPSRRTFPPATARGPAAVKLSAPPPPFRSCPSGQVRKSPRVASARGADVAVSSKVQRWSEGVCVQKAARCCFGRRRSRLVVDWPRMTSGFSSANTRAVRGALRSWLDKASVETLTPWAPWVRPHASTLHIAIHSTRARCRTGESWMVGSATLYRTVPIPQVTAFPTLQRIPRSPISGGSYLLVRRAGSRVSVATLPTSTLAETATTRLLRGHSRVLARGARGFSHLLLHAAELQVGKTVSVSGRCLGSGWAAMGMDGMEWVGKTRPGEKRSGGKRGERREREGRGEGRGEEGRGGERREAIGERRETRDERRETRDERRETRDE
ncbi:unnamed protein product [Diplocarpon coronariae]